MREIIQISMEMKYKLWETYFTFDWKDVDIWSPTFLIYTGYILKLQTISYSIHIISEKIETLLSLLLKLRVCFVFEGLWWICKSCVICFLGSKWWTWNESYLTNNFKKNTRSGKVLCQGLPKVHENYFKNNQAREKSLQNIFKRIRFMEGPWKKLKKFTFVEVFWRIF